MTWRVNPSPVPSPVRLLWCGDTALTVEFGDRIDAALNARVLALDARLRDNPLPGLVEAVPTYRSLTLHFDPVQLDPVHIETAIRTLTAVPAPLQPARRVWRLPVVYGGAFGADLDAVAAHHGLTAAQVITRHAAPTYRVVMIGFLPGYAYLDGLDPSLALSRRPDPRPTTPAGTISIGGVQALVASIAAPSGWHLLGRTPVRAFMPGRDPVFLFEPGDGIRFDPVAETEWERLDHAAASGAPVAECVSP